MNSHILNMVLQATMVAGLMSIVALLVIPVLPFGHNDTVRIERRTVLELNNGLLGNQRLTLALAKKLSEQSSGEFVEVVAVGDGISLLLHNTSHRQDIQTLMNKGVVFTICQLSLQQLAEKLGCPIETLPGVRLAQDGHSYAETLKEHGYIDEFA